MALPPRAMPVWLKLPIICMLRLGGRPFKFVPDSAARTGRPTIDASPSAGFASRGPPTAIRQLRTEEMAMAEKSRRNALKTLSLIAAGTGLPSLAAAESFPARPIRLIVPHAPGGNSDAFGRILALK